MSKYEQCNDPELVHDLPFALLRPIEIMRPDIGKKQQIFPKDMENEVLELVSVFLEISLGPVRKCVAKIFA